MATTEATILFRGVSGDPEEITEETLTLNFTNKLSLQRVAIPDVRIQRTCPWNFPAAIEQRQEAAEGGAPGRFSRFYRCGYSADVPGGAGNLNAGLPFTSCDGSRAQCLQRGMFNSDSSGNINNRYGGFEFIPTSYLVRGATDKSAHLSAVIDNTAKANDVVPLVYGTGWLKSPVVFCRNDGNLTHMEILLGLGEIDSVLKVVVNDVEIPASSGSGNITATGWYSMVSNGNRQGNFNLDFADASGNPLGDPQGSMAVLSVVVPNAISPGTGTPVVQVLLRGMKVDAYDVNGAKIDPAFTNNPAWIVMDVLQRAGWTPSDLNIRTFYQASLRCNELIQTNDLNGLAINVQRYACNLVVNKRQSAANIVRGVRVGASLMLRYGTDGLLELIPEGTLASQQSNLPDGSNSAELLNGGWPAYEFSDGSANFSGIVRSAKGGSTLKLTSANIAETFNRVSVEFQDEANEYQQDSLSLSNTDDSNLIGFEVASQSTALGLPNFNQATRILLRQLDKSTGGNQFVQFQTSFRALKVRPGDIIALTYVRQGFQRTPFRVLKISPSINFELVTILAQAHDDNWYSDDPSVLQNAGRQPSTQIAVPRPLIGTIAHDDSSGSLEYFDFALTDSVYSQQDGSAIDSISVGFTLPSKPSVTSTFLPLVDLSPLVSPGGGTLPAGSSFYYAVTSVDTSGAEGQLSFTIPATLPPVSGTYSVELINMSFPKTAMSFNVYRGTSPQLLYQIAASQAINSSFVDIGLPSLPIGPPDASFHHANFYYRNEYAGPFLADLPSTKTTIGRSDMGAVNGAYTNMVVLITEGTGKGQERSIVGNSATTLSVLSSWSTLPDATSVFVIGEAAWKLAAITSNSPAQFDIAYRLGSVIQVTGRAANILNQESNAELAPISRMPLGGNGLDAGLPSVPSFLLDAPGGGDLTVFGIGFQDLTNVESVNSGTLELFYWNELNTPSLYVLSNSLDLVSSAVIVSQPVNSVTPFVGQLIQIDKEIMSVSQVNAANSFIVSRAAANSQIAQHTAGAPVLYLETYTVVMPFVSGYFQNRASSNYIHTVSIPDIRVSAAIFFVTNSFGSSQASQTCYSGNNTLLRTLSGGQFSLQVNGYLATQQNAAPPLVVQAQHAVRDIRLTLGQAPTGYVITVDLLHNGSEYCQLTFDPSQTNPSAIVDGSDLPPFVDGALLSINLTLELIANYNQTLNPGRDLTVTIRM